MERLQVSTVQLNNETSKNGSFSDKSENEDHHKSIWVKRKAPVAPIPVVLNLWKDCWKTPVKHSTIDKLDWSDWINLNHKLRNIGSFSQGMNITRRQGPNDFFFSKIGRNSNMIVKRENSQKLSNLVEDLSSSSLDTINEKDPHNKVITPKKQIFNTRKTF